MSNRKSVIERRSVAHISVVFHVVLFDHRQSSAFLSGKESHALQQIHIKGAKHA